MATYGALDPSGCAAAYAGLVEHARACATGEDPVGEALSLAGRAGEELPHPGRGKTLALWATLAEVAATDLTVARVIEPHLDALAILEQSGAAPPPPGSTWGVYAAEGPGQRLRAEERDGRWTLSGRKPWCSLADRVSHALVTAWVDDERRGLFSVDLAHLGVSHVPTTWVARGLARIPSGPVDLDDVPAEPVGEPGWYLSRPGFVWGGIGVAAIWYGGAVGLARRLLQSRATREPDQIALMYQGRVDVALHAAACALREAAHTADPAQTDTADPAQIGIARADPAQSDTGRSDPLLGQRARAVVALSAETVLEAVAHALGSAPLTQEEEHARRVADLEVYLRQWHAERDLAALAGQLEP